MNSEDLVDALRIRGREAKVAKREVKLRDCVFCSNSKWNLELNASMGIYHAWCCGASGTLQGFLREFCGLEVSIQVNYEGGRKAREVAYTTPDKGFAPRKVDVGSVLMMLERRGLDVGDVQRYNIGYIPDHYKDANGNDFYLRVTFPVNEYFTHDLAGYVCRSILQQKPKYLYTGSEKVVGGFRHRNCPIHVVVEGVIDGIKVHKAGFNAAVLLGKMSAHITTWAAQLPKSDLVVLILDGDAAEDAHRLYWHIAPIHPYTRVFTLPETWDPGDLHPNTLTQVIHTIRSANPYIEE